MRAAYCGLLRPVEAGYSQQLQNHLQPSTNESVRGAVSDGRPYRDRFSVLRFSVFACLLAEVLRPYRRTIQRRSVEGAGNSLSVSCTRYEKYHSKFCFAVVLPAA